MSTVVFGRLIDDQECDDAVVSNAAANDWDPLTIGFDQGLETYLKESGGRAPFRGGEQIYSDRYGWGVIANPRR